MGGKAGVKRTGQSCPKYIARFPGALQCPHGACHPERIYLTRNPGGGAEDKGMTQMMRCETLQESLMEGTGTKTVQAAANNDTQFFNLN